MQESKRVPRQFPSNIGLCSFLHGGSSHFLEFVFESAGEFKFSEVLPPSPLLSELLLSLP